MARVITRRVMMGVCLTSVPTVLGAAERKPYRRPDEIERARRAADEARNDSLLERGDIIMTERGFERFEGYERDGYTPRFVPVPNPMVNGVK